MAQQMITLEEAAARLSISPEEMKKRLKTDPDFKRLSQIRDGSSVRFKSTAIDELARQLGGASDDGLALPPLADDAPPGSDDFKVPAAGRKPKPPADEPLDFGSSDDEIFSLADDVKPASPKSSGKLTPGKSAKPMSDSSQGSSDSDVRLDTAKPKKPRAADDESAIPTEEIALDFSGPGSAVIRGGSSSKLSAPRTTGSSGNLNPKKGAADDESGSSEFELSLDADSDEFPAGDGDEVDLGSMPKGKGGSGRGASASGINLSDPADSGISLEKGKGKGPNTSRNKPKAPAPADDSDESDVDFELSLDSSAVASSTKLGAPKSGKLVLDSDSDSEFELTLDDSESSLEQAALESDVLDEGEDKGDIFETDFEIPQMEDESASEAVALESDTDLEKDDFELDDSEVSEEESASEVVLLDDEDEGAPKAKKGKAKKKVVEEDADADVDVDLADDSATDDEGSVSKALKGAKGKKKTDDDDEPVVAGAGAPTKPWGIVPVLFLAPALLFTLLGAIMGYELLHTMWGYQQPRKPTAPLVRAIATQFDMELRDQ